MKRHLYLTGYRGSGKTSVGRILADNLSLPLVDLDVAIEATAGMTIREIFAAGGETRFRDLEAIELARVAAGPRAVISLGGGAILRQSNSDLIRATGWPVWLDADATTLYERIQGDSTTATRRPALTQQTGIDEIRTLLEKRQPMYAGIAALKVNTSTQPLADVATEITRWFQREMDVAT